MIPSPPPPPLQETTAAEVLIVAPRSEQAVTSTAADVTVVTGEELVETGERSLPRALGKAAGVWIQESNMGGGAPVIRGLLGNQILIVVDGVRLNDSTTRFGPNQSLATIDPDVVERVEIVRGSSSVLYGSDAIGGVIAIWTKRRAPLGEGAEERPPALHGAAGTLVDSASDGWRTSLELSAAGKSVGGLAALSAEDWGDLESADGEQPFTGFHDHALFGAWQWDLGEHRSLSLSTMVHRDFDVPRTFAVVPGFGQDEAPFEVYDFALQDRRRAVLAWSDERPGGIADRVQVRLSAREYTEQRVRRPTGSTTRTFEETEVDTLGLGADWRKALGASQLLTFGFDLDHDDVDSFSVDTDTATGDSSGRAAGPFAPNARYTSFGAFVQDEILAFDPTFLTLGLRWSTFAFGFDDPDEGDEVSGDFHALTASLEAARDLTEDVRVAATLAQGFQAPNLEDLANDGDFAGGTEIANPELDPAESVTAELALEVQRPEWGGTFALFGTRVDEYIGRRLVDEGDPGTAGDETYLRENAGRVDLFGLEIGGRTRLGPEGSPWSLDAAAAWVRGRQYDEAPLDGVDARRIPPLNGRVTLRWDDTTRALSWLDAVELSVVWAATQDQLHPEDVEDPRIDPSGTDGWAVSNLDLFGGLGEHLEWTVGLHNLFDELYRVHGSGIDGPGRSVVLGLRASF